MLNLPLGSRRNARILLGVLLSGALALSACDKDEARGVAPKSAASASLAAPYPRGLFWRQTDLLGGLVLAPSQILITYRGAQPHSTGLWMPLRPTTRTRAEALRFASSLSATLTQHPEQFEGIARDSSDDLGSAPFGGALGIVRALQLPPAVLDGLAATPVGQLSRVFESEVGFHIVSRREIGDERRYSARHIVIAYQGVRVEGVSPGHGDRSRNEARLLAEQVRARALENTSAFQALAARQSDAPDAQHGGDWGAWSELERGVEPLCVEALRRVPVGGITEIVDTRWGFRNSAARRPHHTRSVGC